MSISRRSSGGRLGLLARSADFARFRRDLFDAVGAYLFV